MNNFSRREFIKKGAISSIVLAAAGSLINGCKTPQWLIGCYTRAWGTRNYLVSLDGMAEAGYKYVGLSTHDKGRVVDRDTPEKVAVKVGEEIRKRGLTLVTLSGGSFDAKKPIDEGIAQLKRLINNAVSCGAPVIQLNDIANPELEDSYYKVIAECCDYGADKRVLLTVKPHGSTGAQCRAYVDRIGHKNFKLWYDPGNVYHYSDGKTDPVEDAAALDGVVVGMAVKDFQLPKNVNITPGTGMVNFPKLLERLGQGGFTSGPLIIECLNPGEVPYINAEARKAREFLEKITA